MLSLFLGILVEHPGPVGGLVILLGLFAWDRCVAPIPFHLLAVWKRYEIRRKRAAIQPEIDALRKQQLEKVVRPAAFHRVRDGNEAA